MRGIWQWVVGAGKPSELESPPAFFTCKLLRWLTQGLALLPALEVLDWRSVRITLETLALLGPMALIIFVAVALLSS
jgi:hypothetical protein